MDQADEAAEQRRYDRVDAGRERTFLIFRAGPMALMPVLAIFFWVFLAWTSGQWYRLWGVPVLCLAVYCFAKAYTQRLPRTRAVLEQGARHDAQGQAWVVYAWLLSMAGLVGPMVVSIPALNY